MQRWKLLAVSAAVVVSPASTALRGQNAPAWIEAYREPAARLIGEATGDTFAWRRLALLTDSIGHRLSGSPQLDRAIEWTIGNISGVASLTEDPLSA